MRSETSRHPRNLRPINIIAKKRDGLRLEAEELDWFVGAYVAGRVTEEEMAAFLMAVYIRGMDFEETAALTMAMATTGKRVDLSAVPGVKLDKHSTGGVGDKTTLVVAPLVAAAGVPVAKMSGRSLGHTGGTIDKLESIPGMKCEMTAARFARQVARIGIAVAAQSEDMCPADKRMYALRDRIGAVASIPLIAASVMSKKLVGGADAIVLDVKCGSGAFMKDPRSARRLAATMVEIGSRAARPTAALVTDMDQPLGAAIGDALEVAEVIEVLRGGGPADVRELSLALGAQMMLLARTASSARDARGRLEHALVSGQALAKFRQFVKAQGGDVSVIDHPERLPRAGRGLPVKARGAGRVRAIETAAIGEIARDLIQQEGPGAGVVLRRKRGDAVTEGEMIAVVYGGAGAKAAVTRVTEAYSISARAPRPQPLILEVMAASSERV